MTHNPLNQQELISKLIQQQSEKRLLAEMVESQEPQSSGLAFVSIFILVTIITVTLLRGCADEQHLHEQRIIAEVKGYERNH